MPMYTTEQIRSQLNLYSHVHPQETVDKWREIDDILSRDHDVRLPPEMEKMDGVDGLKRFHLKSNYSKTIVQSTVTMTLASGLQLYDADQLPLPDREDNPFPMELIRRMLRYMSSYGAAWKLRRPNDKKPIRIYKPHVAREVVLETDPDTLKAVLAVEEIPYRDEAMTGQVWRRARWYEWDDTAHPDEPDRWTHVIRRTFHSESLGDWREVPDGAIFPYMPMTLIRNRDTEPDKLYEASDVYDAMDVIRALDELSTKYLKAMEDEAFRITFIANVTAEQVGSMVSGLMFMHADNGEGERPEPRPYWASPADHRQYMDGFKNLMNRIATLSRTSPLELDERPVQDIPAQTLRVLYGPQISRCQESAEYASLSLTEDLAIMNNVKAARVVLAPRLPISEDKQHQNAKGLLDSGAYSRRQMLIDAGKTGAEADKIISEALAEERLFASIETEQEIEVIKAAPAPSAGE